ncbi:MAG: glycolate oxidase subunit GlcF [Neisseria sp.]|nr:glycolate oxidase subunit GlcF [Neisseria sp.]
MQTRLSPLFALDENAKIAETMLRRCVHCGMCSATCPTYQLTGNELDSPRGRIYLMKQVLEGAAATPETQAHLDRCLTCRACETTCPARVEYSKLLDFGRWIVEQQVQRPRRQRWLRYGLRYLMNSPTLFAASYRFGQSVRGALPASLKQKILPKSPLKSLPTQTHQRKVLLPLGCVQPAMSPNIDHATRRVLDKLGVQVVQPAMQNCCGAVNLHLNAHEDALNQMRRNIDAWFPQIADGTVLISNASGCGATIKEYAHHLRNDVNYAEKARKISEHTLDIVEFLLQESEALRDLLAQRFSAADGSAKIPKIAYHAPCSLQHGQKLKGSVEQLFQRLGIAFSLPRDAHLCCGSAGTYSVLQSELSQQLRAHKLQALSESQPERIVSANIGCIAHLHTPQLPVQHWIEFLDDILQTA